MIAAYQAGQCNVMTTDESGLFAIRLQLAKPGDSMILPDVISKEPLGPVVRQDDMQWFNIVKWVNFAMINAEELGVSSKTIDDALKSAEAVGQAAGRNRGGLRQAARPHPGLGDARHSERSATMPKCSTATSAPIRSSGFRAD